MLKSVSGKRKKTEADHEEMARIEFVAGLYMNELPLSRVRANPS